MENRKGKKVSFNNVKMLDLENSKLTNFWSENLQQKLKSRIVEHKLCNRKLRNVKFAPEKFHK
jgi:hypothetical protein